MTPKQLAASIPHQVRRAILFEWIPAAKPTLANEAFKKLWEAYFIYIDPDGVKKSNCPYCMENVLKNWKHMRDAIAEVEKEYEMLEKL